MREHMRVFTGEYVTLTQGAWLGGVEMADEPRALEPLDDKAMAGAFFYSAELEV